MKKTVKIAIILGASGSVGQALFAEIVKSGYFSRIIVITRRQLNLNASVIVEEKIIPNMNPLNLRQAVIDALEGLSAEIIGFSVLGVGADTAKLILEEHRAIDVELNAAFASGLKKSGRVRHLAFMSAIGADIKAKPTGSGAAGMSRYSRVKGEAEAAVQNQGPEITSIFRPSLIVGSQHTPKIFSVLFTMLESLIPAKYKPIKTTEIAQAMVASALNTPPASRIYEYSDMKKLIVSKDSYELY